MKIVHCLNHYLPSSIGGTELYVHSLAHEQAKDGHEVIILIPRWNELTEWQVDGINVKTFQVDENISREVRAGKAVPSGINNFINTLSVVKPDVLHVHEFTQGNGLSYHHLLAASQSGYKIIITLHLAGYTCKTGELMYLGRENCNGVALPDRCARCMYFNRGLSPVRRNILSFLSAILYKSGLETSVWNNSLGTALSLPFQVKQAIDILKKVADVAFKIIVLNKWYRQVLEVNGIPPKKLLTITQGLIHNNVTRVPGKEITIPLRLVYLGRIAHIKGLHLLLQAMKGFDANEVTLDIYGNENNDEYNRKCRDLSNQSRNVSWRGLVSSEEVVHTLSHYHVMVLPSLSEMSSLVIPEAFAAGIPVLASSIPANLEMIEEGKNGWFFKFNDVPDLRAKIKNLVMKPGMVGDTSKYFTGIRTFQEVWEEYRQVYNSEIVAA